MEPIFFMNFMKFISLKVTDVASKAFWSGALMSKNTSCVCLPSTLIFLLIMCMFYNNNNNTQHQTKLSLYVEK